MACMVAGSTAAITSYNSEIYADDSDAIEVVFGPEDGVSADPVEADESDGTSKSVEADESDGASKSVEADGSDDTSKSVEADGSDGTSKSVEADGSDGASKSGGKCRPIQPPERDRIIRLPERAPQRKPGD